MWHPHLFILPIVIPTVRPPKITVQPAPQELIIPGKSARFAVTTTGYNHLYQWQKDGTAIPGANSHIYSIDDVAEKDEGQYSCVVSNDAGGDTSIPANLTLCKCFSRRLITISIRGCILTGYEHWRVYD